MTDTNDVSHRIVGYDPVSEKVAFSMEVPDTLVRNLFGKILFGPDDPEGYDAYRLEYASVANIAVLANGKPPPTHLHYFIESVPVAA